MICPNCGLEIPADANFCTRCGAPVSPQGKATAAGTAAAAPPAPDSTTTTGSQYVLSSPPDHASERDLWSEYPSMRTALPGIVASLVIGGAIIAVLQYLPFTGHKTAQLVITIIVLVLVLGDMLRHYIRLHSIRYRLTTQRIFITHGLINKRTDEVELEKYKDVFVNQDFWDNIVGCGDIEVITSDVTNPTIRIIDIRDPIAKKETIRAAARERKSLLGITRREEL